MNDKKAGWPTATTKVEPNNLVIAGYPLAQLIEHSNLLETAHHLTVGNTCAETESEPGLVCGCGEDGPLSVPNNVYGWGLLDAWAAVEKVLENQ